MKAFSRLASWTATYAGHPFTVAAAFASIAAWLAVGPLFHWSTAWQIFCNTGTTVITYLVMFLVQNSVNRDTAALHLKLNEIIHALDAARNDTMRAEERTLDEIAEAKEDLLHDAN